MLSGAKLIRADTFEYLPRMPTELVDCVVFSPPYWDIKDYNGKGNLYGNEATLEEYRAKTRVLCRVSSGLLATGALAIIGGLLFLAINGC